MKQILVIYGPPYSGSSHSGLQIAEHYGGISLSLGDLIRKEIRDKSKMGQLLPDYLKKGLGFAGFIMLSLSSHWLAMFLASGFVIGIGCGSIIPTLQTMIMNMVLPERRGAANATYYAAVDLGISVGSVVLGYVATWTSTTFMFRICALMFIVAGAYFFSLAYKHYLRNTLAMS